jgi:hypothetical protein
MGRKSDKALNVVIIRGEQEGKLRGPSLFDLGMLLQSPSGVGEGMKVSLNFNSKATSRYEVPSNRVLKPCEKVNGIS